jgi:hypothetical protein
MPSDSGSIGDIHLDALLPNDKAARSFAKDIHSGIGYGLTMWRHQATLTGVVINSLVATGGILNSPPLAPNIINSPFLASKTDKAQKKLISAIASSIETSWIAFCASVKVPGLPWYPAFAAFPGPVAPPMPNVPSPFTSLTHARGLIAPGLMKPMIRAKLFPDTSADPVIDAVMAAFDLSVGLMLTSMTVKLVMGSGPVPSFAPPYVPVGPVVGGVGNMMPGGFA